jgi:hypothetical protein
MARKKTPAALSKDYQQRYAGDEPVPPEVIEEDLALAGAMLAAGDLLRGAHAIACVASIEPLRPGVLPLLERYAEAFNEGTFTVEDNAQPAWAWAPFRAYAEGRAGNVVWAVEKLLSLCDRRSIRYLEAWALDWLNEDAIEALGQERIGKFMMTFVRDRYPDPPHVSPEQVEHLNRALAILAVAERLFDLDMPLQMAKLIMLGKAGRFPEAIAESHAVYAANPSFQTATMAAMALKRSGDLDGALRMFRAAADTRKRWSGRRTSPGPFLPRTSADTS